MSKIIGDKVEKKLDEIIKRLDHIEGILKLLNPNYYKFELGSGGIFSPTCTCGTSGRCYSCYPYGTIPGDIVSSSGGS